MRVETADLNRVVVGGREQAGSKAASAWRLMVGFRAGLTPDNFERIFRRILYFEEEEVGRY